MNKKQIRVLWITIAIIVLMGLFPPFRGREVDCGYGLIITPPARRCKINITRLAVQWFIVAVIGGGVIYTLKHKKPKDEQSLKGKAISRKTGFKRITLVLAVVAAVICGGLVPLLKS